MLTNLLTKFGTIRLHSQGSWPTEALEDATWQVQVSSIVLARPGLIKGFCRQQASRQIKAGMVWVCSMS